MVRLQPEIIKKTAETEALLKQVAIDQQKADQVRNVVQAEEKVVKKQALEVKTVQADAQADLDMALPALNEALKALDSLKKQDISEVKTMSSPPPAVVLVMEAVCILFGKSPEWSAAQKLMADTAFLQK